MISLGSTTVSACTVCIFYDSLTLTEYTDIRQPQAHDSAAFLAWHRYFIHIYEEKLKEQCGYSGVLTYETLTLSQTVIEASY